jgi:hypothetical protein
MSNLPIEGIDLDMISARRMVERSETQILIRDKAMGFAKGSTHPTHYDPDYDDR